MLSKLLNFAQRVSWLLQLLPLAWDQNRFQTS